MEIKSMQAIRPIHQSFISPIKTGSPWDSDLWAAEYLHSMIKAGIAWLPLSSAACLRTQVVTTTRGQPESSVNLSHSALLTAMQQRSTRAQNNKSGDLNWLLYTYSSLKHILIIYTVYTIIDYFRQILFVCLFYYSYVFN